MAEVMNDLSPSNGEVDEENDEIKLNGDACEDASSINKSSNSIEEPAAQPVTIEKCLMKKLSGGAEIVSLDGLDINASLRVANGRIKSPSRTENDVSNSTDEKRVSEDNGHDGNTDDDSCNEDTGAACDKADDRRSNVAAEETARNESKDGELDEDEGLSRSEDDGANKSEVADGDACSTKSDADKDSASKAQNEQTSNDDDDVISISSTPDKGKKPTKKLSTSMANITPRRSSRNLNKQKSYAEKDNNEFDENATTISLVSKKRGNEDDEIEEVTPTDPLADEPRGAKMRNKTIVVSDTKGLVEFASNAKASRSNKKEPTLVIIDTNSILSGRGPVPVSQQSSSATSLLHSSSAPIPVSLPIPAGAFATATRGATPASSAFSVIPIGLPAQGMYSQFKNPPPQIKPIVVGPASTSVTAVPLSTVANSSVSATTITTVTAASSAKQPPVILPSLTDDMFVVEAPSFIVPYVYEKPPMKSLKEHIDKIEVDIKEAAEKERKELVEKERKEVEEKERKELEDKEREQKEPKTKEDAESEDKDTKTTESEDKTDTPKDNQDDAKKDSTPEKESEDVKMQVDEESDPKTAPTPDSDSTKKSAEPEKKEESSTGKEIDKKSPSATTDDTKKPASYFDNPLGKFFMQIGLNLVQEHVQTDLLRSQKRKRDKEGSRCSQDVHSAIDELTKTLESSKENNDPFKLELKKCELCSFKTESLLVMAHHLETPHMKNYTYRCNFCPLEVRSPHDILFHMEAEHNIRGRLERAPAFHQCPNCPFEDNQKGKLTRHLISCSKKYRPERNQEPPLDWEPPAKIPRVTRNRPPSMSPGNAVYQAAMSGLKQVPQNTLLPKLMPNANMKHNMLNTNKRPNLGATFVNRFPNASTQPNFQQRPISIQTSNQGMMYRPGGNNSQTQVLLSQGYQLSGAQIYQQSQNAKLQSQQQGSAAAKLLNQPSISITPLPRQTPSTQASTSNNSPSNAKAGKPASNPPNPKGTFVVCEICDGYIKDLEQLRNHMQWIHKVKIHPKMIYNRPPLNCQKCQFRFFTDQGLERHLLGSHGLVTSSMQEAANKGKDGGRCPVCGRVYQWKLLNHVARDHQMALKPAHLSYKCTVCTATFGMYKQFESHVYSAHSVVAKRAMDSSKKPSTSSQNDALLKPLKINDEITIIPQPVRAPRPSNRPANATTITATVTNSKGKNDEDDQSCKCACVMEDFSNNEEYRRHVFEKHLKTFKIQISRIDLKTFNRIPDKENAFKLTKGELVANELKSKFNLRDFFIEIKRHRLEADCSYKIVNGEAPLVECCAPEVVYSEVDENDTESRKNRRSMTSNTLYAKRMMNRFNVAENRAVNEDKGSAGTMTVDLTDTLDKPKAKGKPSNDIRKTKKTRKRAKRSSDSEYTPTDTDSSEDDVGRENIANNTHFLLGSKSYSSYAQARKSYSNVSLNQTASRTVCISRTVTTSKTTKVSQVNYPSSNFVPSSSSFTLINRQTVTTNRTMFGQAGNIRPTNMYGTLGSNTLRIVSSNPPGRMIRPKNSIHIVNQSMKVTQRSTSVATAPPPKPATVQKPSEVISLLSDSDSDSDGSVVEIVEPGNSSNNDEVFILPT